MSMKPLTAHHLGRVDYLRAHALQEHVQNAVIAEELGNTLLLLEHPPVITMGRTAKRDDILLSDQGLAELGMERHETGRGGEVTLHAPGQLVCYPIVDLKPDRCDVRRFVQDLAEIMRRLGAEHAAPSGRAIDLRCLPAPHVGVWANLDTPDAFGEAPARMAKIGAIGVRLSRWVTMHGFAFNASTDLNWYSAIVPCGIREHGVTSLRALGVAQVPSVAQLAERTETHAAAVWQTDVRRASAEQTEQLWRRAGLEPPQPV